jgi:hypothetical protein
LQAQSRQLLLALRCGERSRNESAMNYRHRLSRAITLVIIVVGFMMAWYSWHTVRAEHLAIAVGDALVRWPLSAEQLSDMKLAEQVTPVPEFLKTSFKLAKCDQSPPYRGWECYLLFESGAQVTVNITQDLTVQSIYIQAPSAANTAIARVGRLG